MIFWPYILIWFIRHIIAKTKDVNLAHDFRRKKLIYLLRVTKHLHDNNGQSTLCLFEFLKNQKKKKKRIHWVYPSLGQKTFAAKRGIQRHFLFYLIESPRKSAFGFHSCLTSYNDMFLLLIYLFAIKWI